MFIEKLLHAKQICSLHRCKWFLTQNIPCKVNILILIFLLQELKWGKMKWSPWSYWYVGDGEWGPLTLNLVFSFGDVRKPLPVPHVFPAAKGKHLDIGAFCDLTPANCLTLCRPLPCHTRESVPQARRTQPHARPSPHFACGARLTLLSWHSQFRAPETTKIPQPLRFAGFVPAFEFLMTLLFLGHQLFGSSCIFSYHDSIFYA